MITRLTTTLSGECINRNVSSIMQGIIMEHVPPEFAEKAHVSGLRNYSQYLKRIGENDWQWVVNALDDDAKENIIENIKDLTDVYLKRKGERVTFSGTTLESTNFDELFDKYYYTGKKLPRRVNMDFMTPTAFKSDGKYVNLPSARLIVASLIKKYDAVSTETTLYDEFLMEELPNLVEISRFDIRSTTFHLNGVWIPAFYGKVELFVKGGANMLSMVHMLADFAQYSGVGIKSAIGMGAVKYIRDRENSDSREIKEGGEMN